MAEITQDTVEYATVDRLRRMLTEVREPYKVTKSFALFTAILCWVLQRSRTPECHDGRNDQLARGVQAALKKQHVEDVPWQIKTTGDFGGLAPRRSRIFPAFAGMTTFDFFKSLRDAVAHGDARTIQPVNEGGLLVGHAFTCKPAQGEPIGAIVLYREDMRRLGCALAELFCDTMQQTVPEQRLAENAVVLHEQTAARARRPPRPVREVAIASTLF
ncbi:MAG: hypothetical protein KDG89_01035 [Geminicoccaceae bacterium]|nr:hypothetical protein [Geminicoccaceae bacterium]